MSAHWWFDWRFWADLSVICHNADLIFWTRISSLTADIGIGSPWTVPNISWYFSPQLTNSFRVFWNPALLRLFPIECLQFNSFGSHKPALQVVEDGMIYHEWQLFRKIPIHALDLFFDGSVNIGLYRIIINELVQEENDRNNELMEENLSESSYNQYSCPLNSIFHQPLKLETSYVSYLISL